MEILLALNWNDDEWHSTRPKTLLGKKLMKDQSGANQPDQSPAAVPTALGTKGLWEEMKRRYQSIVHHTVDWFQKPGLTIGSEMDDWFQAGQEFLQPVPIDLTETDHQVVRRAEIPGFTVSGMEINVELHCAILCDQPEKTKEAKLAAGNQRSQPPNELRREGKFQAEKLPITQQLNLNYSPQLHCPAGWLLPTRRAFFGRTLSSGERNCRLNLVSHDPAFVWPSC